MITTISSRYRITGSIPRVIVVLLYFGLELFGPVPSLGQAPTTVSELQRMLRSAEYDTIRVNLYQRLALAYESTDIDSSAYYAEQAYALAEQINDSLRIATSLERLAQVAAYRAKLDSAIVLALQAQAILVSIEASPRFIAENLTYLGDFYEKKSQYLEAIPYYQRAISLQEGVGDSAQLVTTLSNLGTLYARTKEYVAAIPLLERSYAIAKALQDTVLLAKVTTNTGSTYIQSRQDSLALVYCKQGLAFAQHIGDLRTQAYNLNNIAQVYQQQKKYKAAIPYYQESLVVKEKLDDKNAMVRSYYGLGGSYKYLQDYAQARQYYNQGLTLAQESSYTYGEMLLHYVLADLDAVTGNALAALDHMRRYTQLNDSILSLEKVKAIEELQARYEAESKDQEIVLLQQESALEASETQRQSNLKNAFIGGVILLLTLLAVLYSRYRLKQKSLRLIAIQKEGIEQRNEKIEIKNQENEVLLREIHHRVKNNLQLILSLLNIQSKRFQDEAVLDFIREGQSRVRSMALVHQDLYQAERLDKVDFGAYLQKMITHLKVMYDTDARGIAIEQEVDDVVLDVNTAIPLGLIVNELVSNTLKHAFTHQAEGSVTIRLRRTSDDHYCLSVADDGVGLPSDFDLQRTHSLGLKLVDGLTNQLHGHLNVKNGTGSSFEVTFPVESSSVEVPQVV